MPTSTKIREALLAKRQDAQKLWDEFEPLREAMNVEDFDPSSEDGKALMSKAFDAQKGYSLVNEECKELETNYAEALGLDGIDAPGKSPLATKEDTETLQNFQNSTPGERVVNSPEYQKLVGQGTFAGEGQDFKLRVKALTRDEHIATLRSRYEMKTLLQSGNVDDPADPGQTLLRPQRLPGYLSLLQAPLKLRNLITVGATDNNTVEWVRQTAVLAAAAEVAEATSTGGSTGTKPESAMAFDLQHTVVQTIAHWIPATRAALADMAQLRTLIDSQLLDGVARRLNTQILQGNGIAPNLEGILAQPIQDQDDIVQGSAGSRKIERVLAAIVKIRLAFLEPSAILMHPSDYEFVRLAKNLNNDYQFGRPSQSGEETLWGVPIIQDVTVAQGQPIVGDWSQAILYVREDVNVLATDSHSDFFVRNMIAILGEGRYALAVPRPDAFCTVDFDTGEDVPS